MTFYKNILKNQGYDFFVKNYGKISMTISKYGIFYKITLEIEDTGEEIDSCKYSYYSKKEAISSMRKENGLKNKKLIVYDFVK